jgi:hypothetical protein
MGLVVAQRVEEVFVREGLIWELRIGGQVIRTTAEHPFFHETRGWLACHHLQVGDKLLCEDGSFVVLEGIRDTGDWETVYNLRIANFHTYFVGCDEWGFSVWSHNQGGCAGKAGVDGKKLLDDGFQEINPSVKTDMLRNAPGKAHGGESLPGMTAGQVWLDKAACSVGRVPQEVASQLRGRNFTDWRNFRQEFWKAVGAVPELLAQFKPDNQARILAGKPPIAPKAGHLGNRIGSELDHMDPLDITGAKGVYDLDNIMVAPPKVNLSFEKF